MRRRCVLCGCRKFAIIINIEFAEILQSLYCRRFFELMITVFESVFFAVCFFSPVFEICFAKNSAALFTVAVRIAYIVP